jgi:hypothetical protein
MGDFSPTKYIDKNVKLEYRNFDVSTNWHTVTVIKIHGHNDNIFLGKFVYCDIKFDSGEIYNHFLFTDKEYESNSDNAWKFAHPWCISINEIKDLNQKLSYTAFDYYNCTSSYDMFSDIRKRPVGPVGHEIDVDEFEEFEEDELEEFEEDDEVEEFEEELEVEELEEELEVEEFEEELEEDVEEIEEFEDKLETIEEEFEFALERPNKRFKVYDNKLDDDQECDDDDDQECDDGQESIQSDIITIIYPGFWSTVLISSIVSTIATTMIIYASHSACSIY